MSCSWPRRWGARSTTVRRALERRVQTAWSATSARPSGRSSQAIVAIARFVGGHPLAGAETAGVENAREDLFDGATWYLTPGVSTDPAVLSSAWAG